MRSAPDDTQGLLPADLTIEEFCSYVVPGFWDKTELLTWPPDVFALVASLLLKSGAYCHAVSGWTRSLDASNLNEWINKTREIGGNWKLKPDPPPDKVCEWHRTLIAKKGDAVLAACDDHALCDALLHLCACADEACKNVGFHLSQTSPDKFLERASERLVVSQQKDGVSTLCSDRIRLSIMRVLPKLHTPQSGITIRSLTHHLALCPAGDVKAKWSECLSVSRHCLNLLLAPWPLRVTPAHFQSVPPERAVLPDVADFNAFFEFSPQSEPDADPLKYLVGLLSSAKRVVAGIDGVVFPELALTKDQYSRINAHLMSQNKFLICGVREPPSPDDGACKNYLQFDIPRGRGPTLTHPQSKHHRWRLDKRQIVQYGLGSCLDVEKNWWEHISIGSRDLHFVVLDHWLTVCPLICEDLARQDPVAEIVRAIGPNLVIALLMDGPQLPSRWPARYATVLADDPGSSVLTLTSLGMAELSRPPSMQNRSRAVALWKDAKTGEAVSIRLPRNADGIVLSLSRESGTELAADGRDDGGTTGYPTLSGIHFVSSSEYASISQPDERAPQLMR
jgi:hypothetical protein